VGGEGVSCWFWVRGGRSRWRNALLIRGCVVGGHVHHEGGGAAAIEEALADARFAAHVGGEEGAVEVGEQVDLGAVVGAICQNAGHGDADVGLCVVADDCGVYYQGYQCLLVGGIVLLEKSGGVLW
jgi:hypothetical protein